MCAGDGRQVTWLALAAEAGSVNKAQEVDRASAARQLATCLTLLVNNVLSAIFSSMAPLSAAFGTSFLFAIVYFLRGPEGWVLPMDEVTWTSGFMVFRVSAGGFADEKDARHFALSNSWSRMDSPRIPHKGGQ